MRFSYETNIIITKAINYALVNSHEFCVPEHVLLFLLEDTSTLKILNSCGFNVDEAKNEVKNYLDKNMQQGTGFPAIESLGFQELINSAANQVNEYGKNTIFPLDILIAFFSQKDSRAKLILENQGLNRFKVIKIITSKNKVISNNNKLNLSTESSQNNQVKEYLMNLNECAINGKIDALIGREREIERVVQILCRRRKNNPILVGEPGVGKTAIAEGLALKIVRKEVPIFLQSAQVFSLDIGQLMSGTKFRGDFEEKIKNLLSFLKSYENSILFIDEIHAIIGAGATSGGVLDAANMLKPFLSNGEVRCIGSTTYKEYNHVFEKDPAFSRRFQKVDILEPTIEETINILFGLKESLENHHHIKYTNNSIKSTAHLSAKHLKDRFFPDKAIDVLDEAGSIIRLKGQKKVTTKVIEKTISIMARIPEKTVSQKEKVKLKELSKNIKSKIYGQDEAIDSVVSAIELSSAGLRSGEKPIGSFLFCGPTGVGKTELCKQLSSNLGIPFIRFDMSEFMEQHSVSKLIGSPPGYVGYNQGGLLVDSVRKNPYSVILLDEIEKAHPDIWNVLLQVMDYGTLTDNNGKKADFRNTILVLTSNVGARDFTKRQLGFGSSNSSQFKPTGAIEKVFTPEFRNRLDAIVYFNPLNYNNVMSVLEKNLNELESQLNKKNITIEIATEVKNFIVKKGLEQSMGARPINRLIQEKIKHPIANQILYGCLSNGGHIKVTLELNEKISFHFNE